MFKPVLISPSILSADFMNVQHDIEVLSQGGADWIHVDVMDGHFVPNLSIGVPFVAQLKKISPLPLDVHLMITNPLDQIDWYLEAGADILNFHIEPFMASGATFERVLSTIEKITQAGRKVGLTVKPDTPVDALFPYLDKLDMVLVMSVYPGFSGQSFIETTPKKISQLISACRACNQAPLVQVDGGIGLSTCASVARVGADVLVCGNAVLKSQDPAQAIKEIRSCAQAAQGEVEA